MLFFKAMKLARGNRMVRAGFGQHESNWFLRIDLWWYAIRMTFDGAWKPGRQQSGYSILQFFSGPHSDAYIIKYPPGSYIDEHVDPVSDREHYRLNICLWGDVYQFRCSGPIFKWWRVCLFRPDEAPHAVSKSNKSRYVLSFGWTKRA